MGKILGYSTEELTSLSPEEIMSLVYHEDRSVFFKRMENRLRGETAEACFEFRAVRKDCSIIWLSSLANRVDYDGQPAVQGMFLDINESKKAAEILSESEQKYRELANCLPDIVFETNLNGQLEFANQRAAEISGYSLDEIAKGLNIFQFIVPEDRDRATKNIQRLQAGDSYVPAEYKFVRKDGTTFPALITATPRICKNKITGFRGMVLDISERKKAEEIVKKSEARYRELANFLPEIVFETDLSGTITFFSQTAFEKTGYTPEEIEKGMNMLQNVVPEDRERANENIRKRMAGEKADTGEYTLFRKNGDTYPALVKTAPIFSESKLMGLRGLVIDISDRKKTEDNLRQSQKLNQKILDCSPNLIYIYDLLEKCNVYANREVFEFLGYTSEQIKSMGSELFANILHPDDSKVVANHHARLANAPDNAIFDVDYRMKHSSGEWRWLHSRDVIFNRTKEGLGKQILGTTQDITGRKRAEEKVRFEAERLERVMENSQDLIMLTKPDGSVVYVNSALKQITGYSETEFVDNKLWIVHPEDSERAREVFGCILKGENVEFEHRIITKDGQTKWVIHSCSPIIREGKVSELVSTVRDITERKKNQDILRKKEKELEVILDSSPTIIFSKDLNGKFVQANKTFAQALNTTKDNLLGKTVFDIYSGKMAQTMTNDDNVVMKSKTSKLNIVEPYESPTGLRWIRTHKIPTFDERGEVTGLIGFSEEITDYKRAEQELKESEEKYKTLFEQAGDYTFILEAQPTKVPIIFDANISALQIHGYTREEIIGKPITFLDKESSIDNVMSRLDKLLNNEKLTFETKHRRKDDSIIDVEVSIKKVKVGSKIFLISVEHDITERKRTENALRQERSMLESVTKNIGSGLVMISKDYKILWLNNFLRQLTGAKENDHCYSSFNTCTTICPDCGPKKIFEGADFDSREYCNQTEFNKDHPVWFELIATPIKDTNGNVIAALELTVNITAKKEAEKKFKENINEIDLMNEKLRVVGSLTRHDARNKLSAVAGYAYLLKKKHGDQADIVEGLDKMEQAVKDTMKIFEFAKMYEQLGVEELTYIDVEKALNEAVVLFSGSTPKVVNDCHGLTMFADSFLRQLFYNFIDNTVKYGKKTTTIRVHFEKVDEDSLKLVYEDDGLGIPIENKSHLFKEGFSTGGSTGFGLFLTKKMVDIYGWEIEEKGVPGIGAKFIITIPKLSKNGKENYRIAT